jgi:hypothetical protein
MVSELKLHAKVILITVVKSTRVAAIGDLSIRLGVKIFSNPLSLITTIEFCVLHRRRYHWYALLRSSNFLVTNARLHHNSNRALLVEIQLVVEILVQQVTLVAERPAGTVGTLESHVVVVVVTHCRCAVAWAATRCLVARRKVQVDPPPAVVQTENTKAYCNTQSQQSGRYASQAHESGKENCR